MLNIQAKKIKYDGGKMKKSITHFAIIIHLVLLLLFTLGFQRRTYAEPQKKEKEKVDKWLSEINKFDPTFIRSFFEFAQEAGKEEKLSVKVKELISIAIAIHDHCKYCIAYHVENAIKAGATKEEIFEAGKVACLMGGGPSLPYIGYAMDAYDQFSASLRQKK
jgi:AhpD family alkylhydroperoxidase